MIERARAGGGPTLIHVQVMRYYGHFEGDATTYKAPDEVAKYKAAKDPLMLFRNRVTEAGAAGGQGARRDRQARSSSDPAIVAQAKSATCRPRPTC